MIKSKSILVTVGLCSNCSFTHPSVCFGNRKAREFLLKSIALHLKYTGRTRIASNVQRYFEMCPMRFLWRGKNNVIVVWTVTWFGRECDFAGGLNRTFWGRSKTESCILATTKGCPETEDRCVCPVRPREFFQGAGGGRRRRRRRVHPR